MKKIFWFVIDSVRSVKTNVDDRDRLEIMDKLDDDFLNFENAYTSAPSTIMSAASMFTGNHTFKMARSYSDWKFDSKTIKPIKKILEKKNFEIFPVDNSKRAREMLLDIIGYLDKEFYPTLSHGKNWSNNEVGTVFENCLKKSDKNKNSFFMCWFDCRHDEFSSNVVEKCINLIKENGLYDDSMIIINSDHGYPDPTATSPAKLNLPHDLVITEDNIKVPLLVKAPNLGNGKKKFNTMLLDIFPTILDYCKIKEHYNHDGISLYKNESAFQNRIVRTDTRLLLQKGKITALIKNKLKYVYYHDTKKSELYNLKDDFLELEDISSKLENETNYFIDLFKSQQNSLITAHRNKLEENLRYSLQKTNFKHIKKIYICSNLDEFSINLLFSLIKQNNNEVFLITKEKIKKEFKQKFSGVFFLDNYEDKKKIIKIKKELLIILEEKNYYRIIDRESFKIFKSINADTRIVIDTNFQLIDLFFSKWIYPLLKYKQNFIFYKKEPSLLITDFARLFTLMIKEYFFKKKIFTPRMEDIKLARDTSLKNKKKNLINDNIGIIYSGFNQFGGTQNQIEKLIQSMPDKLTINIISSKKNQLSVPTKFYDYPLNTKDKLDDELKIFKMKNYPFFYNFFKNLNKNLRITGILIRTFKIHFLIKKLDKVNLYVSFLTNNNVALMCLKFTQKNIKKIIINERNNLIAQKNFLFLKLYIQLIKITKPMVLTNSLITKKFFHKNNINAFMTFNYLPKIDELTSERAKKIILCKHYVNVGRYSIQKDQLGLLNLMSNYLKNNSEFKLTCFGRNQYMQNKYQEFCNENDIKNCSFDSFHPKKQSNIYEKYPILIVNSKFEGQSNALIEALCKNSVCIVNERLKTEMIDLYKENISKFIYFFKNQKELEEILKFLHKKNNEQIIYDNLKLQNNFLNNYYNNRKTLSNYIKE